jgi:hypothetical protein
MLMGERSDVGPLAQGYGKPGPVALRRRGVWISHVATRASKTRVRSNFVSEDQIQSARREGQFGNLRTEAGSSIRQLDKSQGRSPS